MLLRYLLEFYEKIGMEKIVIYNPHYAPSNSFYIKLGAQVLKQEYQMDEKLLVDVFLVDISLIKENIKIILKKYLE